MIPWTSLRHLFKSRMSHPKVRQQWVIVGESKIIFRKTSQEKLQLLSSCLEEELFQLFLGWDIWLIRHFWALENYSQPLSIYIQKDRVYTVRLTLQFRKFHNSWLIIYESWTSLICMCLWAWWKIAVTTMK